MFFEYYLYYLYYTFLGFPFIIRIAVFSIAIFILFFIIALFSLVSTGRKYKKKEKLKKNLNEKYGDKIKEILTSKTLYSFSDIDEELKCNVKDLKDIEKSIITNIILQVQNKENPVNRSNYLNVIDYFEIRNYWEKQIKSSRVAERMRALRKLDDLDMEAPGSIVNALTYNRNQYVRKRARCTYMYFSKNDPYKFLDNNFDKTFNDADRIKIHSVLERRTREGLPAFGQWIENSENVKFQCFLIDEIKLFDQKQSAPYLMGVLKKNDNQLKKHTIDALGDLKYQEVEDTLIEEYPLQSRTIQREIVDTIKELDTHKALPFLKNAYQSAHDSETEIIILRAIYNYGNEGKHLFYSLKEDATGFSRLIFEHVSNPLIK